MTGIKDRLAIGEAAFRMIGSAPLAVLFAVATTGVATAQDSFPEETITLVAPFPPGGAADVVSRILSGPLGEELGVTVVVENRAGGGGRIGTDAVVRSDPDGYTLLMGLQATHSIVPELYDNLGFDPAVDTTPIAQVGDVGYVIYVNNDLPVNSIAELIESAKNDPGAIAYGSAGIGGGSHLCIELLQSMIEGEFTHIPYQGTAPATTALLGGEVDMLCDVITTGLPHIRAGSVKPLAVTTSQRHPLLPELPTVDEAGVEGYESVNYYGLFAPAGVPEDVLAVLREAASKVIAQPGLQDSLSDLGFVYVGTGPEAFADFIAADRARWGNLITSANITVN